MLGSDTWINERWQSYGRLIDGYREWLDQLPRDAAELIAVKNAERIFGPR
jgi:predicted TIM-barrel fold metal-dependent hydrolase